MDGRDRALSTGCDQGAVAALELADAPRQLQRRRRAIEAVGISGLVSVGLIRDRSRVVEQRGRTAIGRRGQRAKPFGYARIRVDELGGPVLLHRSIIGCDTRACSTLAPLCHRSPVL